MENRYKEIVNKSVDLAMQIAKMKGIEIEKHEALGDTLYSIKFAFQKGVASFREMIYLMKDLTEWYCDETLYLEDENGKEVAVELFTPEEKLKGYERRYNYLLDELEQYKKTQKEINQYGYEKLLEERKHKIIEMFKEMLDYKNKKYDKNWTMRQFAEKISQYYNIYSTSLWNAVSAANMGAVQYDIEEDALSIDQVESIMFLDDFNDEIINYKEDAYYYRDFELEEGQTFRDLYDLEIEKFIQLFKEMLDYRNIGYDKNDNSFGRLKLKIMESYPYYTAMLFHLPSPNPNTTYIQELDSMENVYEKILSEYKNHEENLIKYKDYMELLKKEGYIN